MAKVSIDKEAKPIWQSKTMWVAVLTIAIGILQGIQGDLQQGIGISTLGIINILLRGATTSGVKLS